MQTRLKPGLYIIATPIGHFDDITVRALQTLKSLDCLYCEDTRVTKKLLNHHGIDVKLSVYNDYSSAKCMDYIVTQCESQAIGLVSDAGTPLISDPGYRLIQTLHDHNIHVESLPGACAAITALTLSAMPTDKFCFCGFYDPKKTKQIADIPATLIFYEAPHRLEKTLEHIHDNFKGRRVSIHRELTKLYEQTVLGEPLEILNALKANNQIRGEFVIVVAPPEKKETCDDDIRDALTKALVDKSSKDAILEVSTHLNVKKNRVYKIYLNTKNT